MPYRSLDAPAAPRPAARAGAPSRALVVLALLTALALGCSATATPTAGPAPTTVGTAAAPGTAAPAGTAAPTSRSPGCGRPATEARSTQVGLGLRSSGRDRSYQLYVPGSAGADPTPLVIDLHGYLSGAAGQAAMSDFARVAERAGFVLVTPQGNGPLPYWNAVPHAELPDDVQFVSDIIDDVSGRLCIDPARVYVDGLSNGAFLASLVACRLADKVAAVAAVAGLLYPADCAPSRPVPILAIHGTADRFVTFDGSPNEALATLAWNAESTAAFTGLPFGAAPATLGRWAALEGCAEPPEQEPVGAGVTVTRYRGCRDGSALELYVVDGGGHTWPGSAFSKASEAVLGPTTTAIDADERIWSFFEAHPMPAR